MALTAEILEQIAVTVEQQGLSEATLQALRHNWQGVHFTYCLDDDVHYPKPYAAYRGFNLYLVDGREHCLHLTNDLQCATGVVLAEVIDDA